MKKLAVILAAVVTVALTGCGTDSKSPLITYVARGSSDITPHLYTLSSTTGTPTAVSIPIPSSAWYVASNNTATEVAYYRSDDAGYDLFLMGKDGTEKPLTTDGRSWAAAFSPDGKTIVYSDYTNGPDQVFVMNSDGSSQHALYAPVTDEVLFPTFSPDGKSVVFYLIAGGPLANTHTRQPNSHSGPLPDLRNRNLNAGSHRSMHPQIAEPSQSGWYTMALTDTTPTLVYATTSWWGPAVYSADGKKLLVTMYDGIQDNVFSISPLDGTGVATALTTSTDTYNFSPVPYKNLILFNRYNNTTNVFDIYVMDQTGANQTLANSSASTYEGLQDAYFSEWY